MAFLNVALLIAFFYVALPKAFLDVTFLVAFLNIALYKLAKS